MTANSQPLQKPAPAQPALFDAALGQARLKRALKGAPADFLLTRAAGDLTERLSAVVRRFTSIADVLTPLGAFGEAALERYPGAALQSAPEGPGGSLGLAPAGFDLIVSGLALHHVNDLPGALAQIRRALKPDGLFLGCMAGGATLNELRQSLAEAESDVTGGVSPRVSPFADVRDAGALLQRAGLALPVADSDAVTAAYPHLFALMADLRAMGATNILAERLRRPTPRAVFARAAEIYAEKFPAPGRRIRATFELIWFSGWAPHDSQQKPLRPGSATARLADALQAIEISAGEKAGGV